MAKRKTGDHPDLKLVNPNAAALDIGSTMHMAAVFMPVPCGLSGLSRKTCMIWPTDSNLMASQLWRWNRRACIGFLPLRFWKRVASR